MRKGNIDIQGTLSSERSQFSSQNLVVNGSFERWINGVPAGWTLNSGSVAIESTIVKIGDYSAKVTRSGSNCSISQNFHTDTGIDYWKGRVITISCWVYATVASRGRISVFDGVGYTDSTDHTGDSTWQLLTVTKTISASATQLTVYFNVVSGDTSVYWDGAILIEGSIPFDYTLSSYDSSYEFLFNNIGVQNLQPNGSFKYWAAGVVGSVAPDGWFMEQNGSSTLSRETSTVHTPLYPHVVKLVRSGGTYLNFNSKSYPWRALSNVKKTFTGSVWVKSSVVGAVKFVMHNNSAQNDSKTNQTTDWELLYTTLTQDSSDVGYGISIQVIADSTVYVSEVMCVEGTVPLPFQPHSKDTMKDTLIVQTANNIILNGNFDYWYAGASSAPDGWATAIGGSVAQEASTIKNGTYSAKYISGASGGLLYNRVEGATALRLRGKKVTFSAWVYAANADSVCIAIADNAGTRYSAYHPGDSTWQRLTVTHEGVSGSTTNVDFHCQITGNTHTAYFDGCMAVEGDMAIAYSPNTIDDIRQRLPAQGVNNLILNGSFEYWYSGTSSIPDGWVEVNGGVYAQEATIKKIGSYSFKITSGGADCNIKQEVHAEKGIAYWQGRKVTFSVWVYASTASKVNVYIGDGVGNHTIYHTGSGQWELLTLTRQIDASATAVIIQLRVGSSGEVAYFDGCMAVEGEIALAYSPHIEDPLYKEHICCLPYTEVHNNSSDTNLRGIVQIAGEYCYAEVAGGTLHFSPKIPTEISGHPIIIDSILVGFSWASSAYIDSSQIFVNSNTGTRTYLLTNFTDYGSGASGSLVQEILSASIELPTDKSSPVIQLDTVGGSGDLRVHQILIKYHIKVHG